MTSNQKTEPMHAQFIQEFTARSPTSIVPFIPELQPEKDTRTFPPSIDHSTPSDELASFMKMQELILEKQKNNEPFFIGRISGNEPYLCSIYRKCGDVPDWLMRNMLFGAGIQFLNKMDLEDYVDKYTRSFEMCDLVGVWSGGPMYTQGYEFYEYISSRSDKLTYEDKSSPFASLNNVSLRGPYAPLIDSERRAGLAPLWVPICAASLEPFQYMNDERFAYAKIFENKKVLILTSHSKTIKSQLNKRDKLFTKPIFSESTKIFVHKTPQQNAGNHDERSWKLHFDKLKTEIDKIKNGFFDFDIALVSCGGFGMPISHYIRTELGKSVIYVGGVLQLYFGVMGGRWEQSEKIRPMVNEHWTRPLDIDKPLNPEFCERSCYW